MNLVVHIPDTLAARLGASGSDLERRALEAFVAGEYRAGRMETADLREALGFDALDQVDGFLKAHGVFLDYGLDDLDRDRRVLAQLGF